MKSLRFKITLYFIGMIVLILVVFTVGINNYFDRYYYGKKIEAMNEVSEDIETVYEKTRSEDEALRYIDMLGYHFEGKISIFDQSTNQIVFVNKRYEYTVGEKVEEIVYNDHMAYIYETQYPQENARWLMYIDKLDNNKYALLQVSVVAIDDAIQEMETFFNILMGIVFIGAISLAMILARNISAPIKQLHKVSESIGDLSFRVKYSGRREDEIGMLGRELNRIGGTLKMTIDDLNVQLEKGKSIDRMRRRFVATVSHELQTPISIISSYVEALQDGIVEPDEIDAYYEVIQEESEKMSSIVKDLLQLSQLESDNVKFKVEAIDFGSFMARVLDKYEPLAVAKNVDFHINLPAFDEFRKAGKCLCISGDSLRLELGVTNILSNALKHSDDYIRVDLTRDNNKLILSIENSGDLIEEQDLEHVFDSFYKGKTKRKIEGTGLGLSIASKIFDKHHIMYKVYNKSESVVFQLMIPILEE